MNKLKLLYELNQLLDNFECHPELIKDLAQIIKNSGAEKAFLSKFRNGLKFLVDYGEKAHLTSNKNFEKLKGKDDLFSMHISNKSFNIRVLYSFRNDGTILIHAFLKKKEKMQPTILMPL